MYCTSYNISLQDTARVVATYTIPPVICGRAEWRYLKVDRPTSHAAVKYLFDLQRAISDVFP
jgi:hypothetical protein